MLALSAALALGLAATPAADTVSFKFGWPESFAADVAYSRSRTQTGRAPSEQRLRGRLVTEKKGGDLRVGFRDWRAVASGGAPARIDPMMEAASRITTVATRDGTLVRVEGIEPAMERFRAMAQGAPAEARPTIERLVKMAPALLTKEASETWSMLVQFWHGKELEVGADYESDERLPVAVLPDDTIRLVSQIRVERRLPCPGGRGACVEVRLRSTPDAKDTARVMKRMFAELSLPAAQLEALVGELSTTTEVVLVADPAGLLPYRLEKTREYRSTPAPGAPSGAKPLERRDASVWIFTRPAGERPPAR